MIIIGKFFLWFYSLLSFFFMLGTSSLAHLFLLKIMKLEITNTFQFSHFHTVLVPREEIN